MFQNRRYLVSEGRWDVIECKGLFHIEILQHQHLASVGNAGDKLLTITFKVTGEANSTGGQSVKWDSLVGKIIPSYPIDYYFFRSTQNYDCCFYSVCTQLSSPALAAKVDQTMSPFGIAYSTESPSHRVETWDIAMVYKAQVHLPFLSPHQQSHCHLVSLPTSPSHQPSYDSSFYIHQQQSPQVFAPAGTSLQNALTPWP